MTKFDSILKSLSSITMNTEQAVIDYDNIANLACSMCILGKTESGALKIRLLDAILHARIEMRVTKADGVVVNAVEVSRTEHGPISIRMELLHGENHEFYGYRISEPFVMADLILCIAVLEMVCKKVYTLYQNTAFVPCMPSLEILNNIGGGVAIYHPTRRSTSHTNEYHEKEGFRTFINYKPKESHPIPISSKIVRADICQFDVMLGECEHLASTSSHVNIDLKEYRSTVSDIMQKMDQLRAMLLPNA